MNYIHHWTNIFGLSSWERSELTRLLFILASSSIRRLNLQPNCQRLSCIVGNVGGFGVETEKIHKEQSTWYIWVCCDVSDPFKKKQKKELSWLWQCLRSVAGYLQKKKSFYVVFVDLKSGEIKKISHLSSKTFLYKRQWSPHFLSEFLWRLLTLWFGTTALKVVDKSDV